MAEFGSVVFDPAVPVAGRILVEASAGTGKTYNIQNAYLRLVLTAGIPVEKLLVVTFTEAATQELRDRLRGILTKCRDGLDGLVAATDKDYPRVCAALALPVPGVADDRKQETQRNRIRLALMDFDNASIFTIHGFCKRVLDRYAFECGHDPEGELLHDQTEVVAGVCRDWWRRNTYVDGAGSGFCGPGELCAYVKEQLARPDAELRPRPPTPVDLAAACARVKMECSVFLAARDSATGDWRKVLKAVGVAESFEQALRVCAVGGVGDNVLPASAARWAELMEKAKWEQSIEWPEELEAVRAACARAWGAIGDLRGTIAWGAGECITKAKKQVDLGALHACLMANRDGVSRWIAGAQGIEQKAVREAVGALAVFVQWAAGDRPDAKTTCQKIKALGELEASDLAKPCEMSVAEVCPALSAAVGGLTALALGDKVGQIEAVAEMVRRTIRERRTITYDSMLVNVRDALADAANGAGLVGLLREEFKAALIDEFQDTDPVQYAVFRGIFAEAGVPLLFVGDPKQAIYGFRGGDVQTYLSALGEVPEGNRHTLGTNYRSEDQLVAAVNELFGDGGGGQTFASEAIRYAGDLKANGVDDARRLSVHGVADARPLRIWEYAVSGSRLPGKGSRTAMRIYADVADEIVAILSDPALSLGVRPVRPGDIAVLVSDHEEAALIEEALRKRKVDAVRQSTGNVFGAPDAKGLALVLQAMLTPGDPAAVRSALATGLLPCTMEELVRFRPDALLRAAVVGGGDGERPQTLEQWMEVFSEAAERWVRRSFIEGFRYLADRLGLKPYLARSGVDGLRRITDLMHLAELLHLAARESQLGPFALVRWYTRQLDEGTRAKDERQATRRASDADAVNIMTVFISKGLEFPVVFVPTLWRKDAALRRPDEKVALYHDGDRMILDLDTKNAVVKDRMQKERLEEMIRLCYVAATRAVNRTYLVSVSAGDPAKHALQRTIGRWKARRDEGGSCAILFGERAADGESAPVCEWTGIDAAVRAGDLQAEGARRGAAVVDKTRGHTSFSAVAAKQEVHAELLRDRDGQDDGPVPPPADACDIFSIPGGARTGDCWHSILEDIDFAARPGSEPFATVVDAALDRFGICDGATGEVVAKKRRAVHEMIGRVLTTPLQAAGGFALKDIARSARRSEMPFHFSLKQRGAVQTVAAIGRALERSWRGPARDEAFIQALVCGEAALPLGFMTGFIDLVCCHEERFYVLDWKSNKLNGRIEGFRRQGLAREMMAHSYYLQYMIYIVALHGYLSRALEGYDYDRHMGGALYVFLRGVTGAPGCGVFADRPSRELAEDLARVLAAGEDAV